MSESAVVGFPHDLFGEGIYAYISPKEHIHVTEEVLIEQLKQMVKSKISGYAVPHHFLVFL